jgi:bidirectional [NiFe] hydrogenase diaphorase subunit
MFVDGHYVQVEDGLPIIEACKRLNIFIPTLCYLESLKLYGSCRLCIVELVQNRRARLVTSCNYQATEGLQVFLQITLTSLAETDDSPA